MTVALRLLWIFPGVGALLLLWYVVAEASGAGISVHGAGIVFVIVSGAWIVLTILGWPLAMLFLLWRARQGHPGPTESAAFVPSLATWVLVLMLVVAFYFTAR